MTTNARIERTGIGGKYAVRVAVQSDGLRFGRLACLDRSR